MTRFSVPDMTCGHCKAAVEAALATVPDTGAVSVNLTARHVDVTGDAPGATLIAALGLAEYTAKIDAG